MLENQTPWYADIVNYLACGIMPYYFNYQHKRKLTNDTKFYIWDDPLLFKRDVYMIIRRCVPKSAILSPIYCRFLALFVN